MNRDSKVYIMVDFEGGACVVGASGGTLNEHREQYELARRVLTAEANAAAEGAFAAGAREVIVNDAHGGGVNLLYEQLHPDVKVVLGTPRPRRFPGMDETFCGLCLIGYHARAGTCEAVIAHSYSSQSVHRMWINGQEVGEIAVDAAYAGTVLGVPTIFVSGDDKAVAEAQELLGDVETVAVKRGFGRDCALSLTPRKACELIRAGVERAVRNADAVQPLRWEPPYELRVVYKHEYQADETARMPNAERVDAYTVVRRAESLAELFF